MNDRELAFWTRANKITTWVCAAGYVFCTWVIFF